MGESSWKMTRRRRKETTRLFMERQPVLPTVLACQKCPRSSQSRGTRRQTTTGVHNRPPRDNFRCSVNPPPHTFLECGRKAEHLEKSHAGMPVPTNQNQMRHPCAARRTRNQHVDWKSDPFLPNDWCRPIEIDAVYVGGEKVPSFQEFVGESQTWMLYLCATLKAKYFKPLCVSDLMTLAERRQKKQILGIDGLSLHILSCVCLAS